MGTIADKVAAALPPPHPFLLSILPQLFSATPSPLPTSTVSKHLSFVHTYLSPSPASPAYLQINPSDHTTALYHQAVESDRWDPSWDQTDSPDERGPGYRLDRQDGIFYRVPVGDDGLAVVLHWEEESPALLGGPVDAEIPSRPSWTFHSLVSMSNPGPLFYPSLQEALETAPPLPSTSTSTPEEPQSAPSVYDLPTSLRDIANGQSPPSTAAAASNSGRPGVITLPPNSNSKKVDPADGEGTTPGAYGSSNDFWDGWGSDDDDNDVGARGAQSAGKAGSVNGRAAVGEDADGGDDDYWNSYGEASATGVNEEQGSDEEMPAASPSPSSSSYNTTNWGAVEEERKPNDRPRSITRSRRSSTIRAPQPPTVPIAAPSASSTPTISSAKTNGFHPAPPSSETASPLDDLDREDESLRFALAGVWALYSKGSKPGTEEHEEKIRKWRAIGEQVWRS